MYSTKCHAASKLSVSIISVKAAYFVSSFHWAKANQKDFNLITWSGNAYCCSWARVNFRSYFFRFNFWDFKNRPQRCIFPSLSENDIDVYLPNYVEPILVSWPHTVPLCEFVLLQDMPKIKQPPWIFDTWYLELKSFFIRAWTKYNFSAPSTELFVPGKNIYIKLSFAKKWIFGYGKLTTFQCNCF